MVTFTDIFNMNVGQILQTTFVPRVDLTGQVIVITGANTGLGLEAAKHFYRLNASHLILACRDLSKGKDARHTIISSCPGRTSTGIVEVWQLDMASFASVLAFGDQLKSLPRLDAFVANAGIDTTTYREIEGHESIILVNVISTLLVGILAIPVLESTSKEFGICTRLVFATSVIHIFAKHQYLTKPPPGQIFATLGDSRKADMADRYHLSKLMELLLVRELADRLEDKGIPEENGQATSRHHLIITSINPGWCKTDLFREHDGGLGGRIGLALIGRTAEEGSRTLVHAATASTPEMHGQYLSECCTKNEGAWVRSEEGRKVGWDLWEEFVGVAEGVGQGVMRF